MYKAMHEVIQALKTDRKDFQVVSSWDFYMNKPKKKKKKKTLKVFRSKFEIEAKLGHKNDCYGARTSEIS